MKTKFTFLLLCFIAFAQSVCAQEQATFLSPDKRLCCKVWISEKGVPYYNVQWKGQEVIQSSTLGFITTSEDYSLGLQWKSATGSKRVKEKYELFAGKKREVKYEANQYTVTLTNASAKTFRIIFQISNDGIAFRYHLPGTRSGFITTENTSFHFDADVKGFLQPMQVSKSGWEKTNPAYEEHYQQNIKIGDSSLYKKGWVYPALFQKGAAWMLITEAAIDSNDAATHLQDASADGNFLISLPDKREGIKTGNVLPRLTSDYYSPWRIITVGSLATIAESTLGTDLAKPAISMNKDFIKPGKASWSWIMSKDDSIVYTEQVRYIDLAQKMGWQYCLVDADWDRKIGYDRIKTLSQYAALKGVGLLLWYNSAGNWNTVKYTPKNKLLTHEDRLKEFGLLKEMGIKGVKIDFFGGDGQSVMQYYIDILNDAAQVGLMVNFHGATLPRGWHRTYPHLLTTEAVRGFEMVTFGQRDANAEANHCAMLPFTRNAFDPMDFTPMNLSSIPTRVKRKTTSGFELALSVLFISGIQHYAESPSGMATVPVFVQQFLQDLPNQWEDVKFIDGFPGKYVVIARKSGKRWYIAGINGENTPRKISIDLGQFKKRNAYLIADGQNTFFDQQQLDVKSKAEVELTSQGGFVLVLY